MIHPRWAIEEYASSFRMCVWFSPPHPPRVADKSPNETYNHTGWAGNVSKI